MSQRDEHGEWHVLPWQPIGENATRPNAALPQGLWDSHITLISRLAVGSRVILRPPFYTAILQYHCCFRSPLKPGQRLADDDTIEHGLTTPYDMHTHPGFMQPHERGTLRSMASMSKMAAAAPVGGAVDAGLEGVVGAQDTFSERYFNGHGDTGRSSGGNPSMQKLLEVMPEKALVQTIFEAAGVPEADRSSPKLCVAMHVAANILTVDMTCWASMVKSQVTTTVDPNAAIDLDAMLGCGLGRQGWHRRSPPPLPPFDDNAPGALGQHP